MKVLIRADASPIIGRIMQSQSSARRARHAIKWSMPWPGRWLNSLLIGLIRQNCVTCES